MRPRLTVLFVLLALAWTAAARAQPRARHRAADTPGSIPHTEVTEEGMVYTVQAGDTLSEVAERLEVQTEDVLRWNPDLDADHIRSGQRLRIDNGLRRVAHRVQRGESLSRIASRYEVRVSQILRWNRRLNRDRVREGREVVVFTHVPASRSQSVGTPQTGRLVNGRQLPARHPGVYLPVPRRAWGTDEAVRWLIEGLDEVREHVANTPAVEVHDLSLRHGGALFGHRSHRSGRDADVAYFQTQCPRGRCAFRRIHPQQIDAARQWRLLHHWLTHEQVEAIFIDYALQRPLYEAARAAGVSRRDLGRWFQYPRPIEDRYGLIRHHPRHADHLHVRFVCHDTDPDCR